MFTECYCTQFRRSANALTQIYDDTLRPLGLKITQLSLLRALDRLEAATYNEIAAEVALDKTTISRNIKSLIEAGWVVTSPDDDARYKVARLSDEGIRVLAEAQPYWREAQARVEREIRKYFKGPAKTALLEVLQTLQGVGSA
ncbi:MarR family winged helix-turn-helix transcriptional regulator [Burkholderia sp. 22PA0099]|uniref:MarR family winged helix-turn-helix transcriptional regulator n=1 Tax=unclassified Burkholderia TaxID=2613784 RepID=UPI0039C24D2A